MRYLSVCSGIEAATVAWHPLGWTPVAFSEIEPFPSAVLAHHYPNVPNYGDMTKFQEWPLEPGTVDLLVGGTPCQSFSVAGLRKGISDPRGGLMLTYLEIARRFRPRWIVWENVPGVLSSNGGRDFGSFLGGLEELGYGWAYRVLDAQWCRTHGHPRAVPQRRRRVFVVGCLGDPARAAQVLFERESVQRDSSPRGTTRQSVAADAEAGAGAGCWWDGSDCAGTLTKQNANGAQRMPDKDNFGAVLQPVAVDVADALVAKNNQTSGFQTEVCAQPVGYRWQNDRDGLVEDGTAPSCRASAGSSGFHEMNHPVVVQQSVAFSQNQREEVREVEVPGALAAEPGTHQQTYIAQPVPYDLFQITAPVNRQNRQPGDPCHTLARDNAAHAAVAFTDAGQGQRIRPTDQSSETLRATKRGPYSDYYHAMSVRRLTPKEAERLQGFPDDYTAIPWRGKPADQCPDGPRYKALGNSMACNCMAWIGERIAAVDSRHDL